MAEPEALNICIRSESAIWCRLDHGNSNEWEIRGGCARSSALTGGAEPHVGMMRISGP